MYKLPRAGWRDCGTVAATYGYLGSTDVKEWGADTHIETPLALLQLLRFRAVA